MSSPTEEIPASAVLERTAICSELSKHELEDLAAITTRRHLKAGELLFRQGEKGSTAAVLASGALEVFVGAGPGKTVLATLEPYQMLGELSLLEPEARSASVVATVESEVLEISHESLAELREEMNTSAFKLIRAISQLICRRIRNVNVLIENELSDGANSEVAADNINGSNGKQFLGIFRRLFKGG